MGHPGDGPVSPRVQEQVSVALALVSLLTSDLLTLAGSHRYLLVLMQEGPCFLDPKSGFVLEVS